MNDIAERLRQGVDPDNIQETEAAMDAGSDEIERLRWELSHTALVADADRRDLKAEIERLRAALRRILSENDPDSTTANVARAALVGKP